MPIPVLAFVVICLGIMPFAYWGELLDPARYPQWLVMAAGMLPLLVSLLRRPGGLQAVNRFWWVALAGLGWGAASMLWALNAAETWVSVAHFAFCLGFLVMARQALADQTGVLDLATKVLTVSMGLQACIGLLQLAGVDPLELSTTPKLPVGTMTNPNFYGDALLLGLPWCLYGLGRLQGKGWRVGAGVSTVLCIAGIVASRGRSSIMPMLLAAAFITPLFIWQLVAGKMRWVALGAWVLGLGLALYSTQFIFKKKEGTYNFHYIWEDGHEVEPLTSSVDHRFITWHKSLDLFAERPLQGVGAGNWKLEIQRTGLIGYDSKGGYGLGVAVQPHNEYVGVLTELGIVGLALLLTMGGLGIWGAVRMAVGRAPQGDRLLGLCLLVGWLGFGFDAAFNFPLERPFQCLMVFWMLSVSLERPGSAAPPLKWLPRWAGILCLLAWIGGTVTFGFRLSADRAMREVRDLRLRHQPQRVLALAPRATNWCTPLDPASAMPLAWYEGMAYQEMGNLPQALAAFEEGLRIAPYQYGLLSGRASLLDMSGRHLEAAQAQSRLLQTFPTDWEGWLNLAIMQIHAGQPQAARAALSKVPGTHNPSKREQVEAVLRANGF